METIEMLEVVSDEEGRVQFTHWTEQIALENIEAMMLEYQTMDDRYAKAHNTSVSFTWRVVKDEER